MKRLAISLVLYNNRAEGVAKLTESIRASTLAADLFVIDNSPLDHAALFESCESAHYARNEKNTGYGAGHNLVLKDTLASYDYHLVVNPDIFFDPQVLERIVGFMDEHPEIGHLMPKILYPDGRIQYLCKNLPRPWHLVARRILPPRLAARWNDRYEMRYADYNRVMDVPFYPAVLCFCAALHCGKSAFSTSVIFYTLKTSTSPAESPGVSGACITPRCSYTTTIKTKTTGI